MKKIKVTLANNEVMHLERHWYDYWLLDLGKMMSFWQKGKRIKISNHWIIKIEEETEEEKQCDIARVIANAEKDKNVKYISIDDIKGIVLD